MLPVVLLFLTLSNRSFGQETFPVNGTVNKQMVRTALEHATVHVSASEIIKDATVVIYQGRIETVGPSASIEPQ